MAQPDTDTQTDIPAPRPSRSPEEVQAALEEARHSLVAHVDAIKHELSPAELAKRPLNHVRRIFVADDGKPKTRTIAIISAAVVIYVVYRIRK